MSERIYSGTTTEDKQHEININMWNLYKDRIQLGISRYMINTVLRDKITFNSSTISVLHNKLTILTLDFRNKIIDDPSNKYVGKDYIII